jgi:predicted amidohydrolase
MVPAKQLRIASAQYPLEKLPSLGDYRSKLARWVAEAARNGAKLLVFPEYGAMEYAGAREESLAGDLEGYLAAVSDALGPMDATHAELAAKHGVHILAASGPARRPDRRYVNAARLFAPSGAVGVQEKLIMTPIERTWGIAGGTRLKVFDTAIGRFGVAICYDSEFPLLVRAQAEAGAEVILIPSCTEFISGSNRVRTAARARALENTCAAVVAATIGDAPWSPLVDRSCGSAGIYVPAEHQFSDSGALAEGPRDLPQWVFADVDIARLRALTSEGEVRNVADWSLQPGSAPLAAEVEIVALR